MAAHIIYNSASCRLSCHFSIKTTITIKRNTGIIIIIIIIINITIIMDTVSYVKYLLHLFKFIVESHVTFNI